MLPLPPSVAKCEPESSELSSSDLSNIIDLYEDDLPASAALDTAFHCRDIKHGKEILRKQSVM